MRAPTVKDLVAAFRDLDRAGALLIRRLCSAVDDADDLESLVNEKCPETAAYVRALFSDPYNSHVWRRTVVLHAIDKILGTHGVEALGDVDMRSGPPYEYCNAGDPYVATLIYDRDADALIIGCWGDIAEKMDAGADDGDE